MLVEELSVHAFVVICGVAITLRVRSAVLSRVAVADCDPLATFIDKARHRCLLVISAHHFITCPIPQSNFLPYFVLLAPASIGMPSGFGVLTTSTINSVLAATSSSFNVAPAIHVVLAMSVLYLVVAPSFLFFFLTRPLSLPLL